MVFTDSCFAESMNEQVFTTMMSASSAREVISAPPWESRPIMTSLSTRFLGQPKLTNPIFLGVAADVLSSGASSSATESAFECMQSLHSNIVLCGFHEPKRATRSRFSGLGTVFLRDVILACRALVPRYAIL